ncbi:MAG: Crp/Fnr family transcriptional regulator [Acidobacteria bacterium]|nr:Crp/Fnr family transcriptional regulator [Acidobacteriota bacterium]
MIQKTPQAERFKQQLRDSLQREVLNTRSITIAKHSHIYTCGDSGETVYFIEGGQVKLLMISPAGKEGLLDIYTAGDIFGESCLAGLGLRMETATAMEETTLKQIPCARFIARLSSDGLFEGFVQYLVVRIADQQQLIANLVSMDSEQRLGKTLLQLAHKLGRKTASDVCIEHKISQEELSEMVGTTRPRINVYAAFSESWAGRDQHHEFPCH